MRLRAGFGLNARQRIQQLFTCLPNNDKLCAFVWGFYCILLAREKPSAPSWQTKEENENEEEEEDEDEANEPDLLLQNCCSLKILCYNG